MNSTLCSTKQTKCSCRFWGCISSCACKLFSFKRMGLRELEELYQALLVLKFQLSSHRQSLVPDGAPPLLGWTQNGE